MKNIYFARQGDAEGRYYSEIGYFEDAQDAYAAAGLTTEGKRPEGSMNTNTVQEVTVWAKGEYNTDTIKRLKALSKLTDEEKKLLGL